MDLFYEPHRKMLKQLIEGGIKFMMIGGYAVNYHGFSRPTGDLDLWLEPSDENKHAFITMLEKYKFDEEGIEYIKNLDFNKPEVFCMGKIPVRIDFLTKIAGIAFEEADKEKIIADIEGMPVPVINLKHLVISKISNERTKDKLDVEELQKIQRLKNKK